MYLPQAVGLKWAVDNGHKRLNNNTKRNAHWISCPPCSGEKISRCGIYLPFFTRSPSGSTLPFLPLNTFQ